MITNPDYSRLTRLIKLLEEVAILEYEKKVAMTNPISKTTHNLLEHRLVFLKQELKGYKYYEIECAELLISDIVKTEKLQNKICGFRNQRISCNKINKALNKPLVNKEGMDLFMIMLVGWIQANTNRFDNASAMNMLLNYIISIIEEDNLGRRNNYGY
jgi:hypothetical protein